MNATNMSNASLPWLAKGAQSAALLSAACTLFLGAATAQAQPVAPPATPTLPSGNVLALYNSSATYANISGINYYESWGGWASAADYSIPPVVLGYHTVNYGGIGFEGNPQDVSAYVYLHVDLYTPNGSSFAVALIDTSTGQRADYTYTTAGGVIVPNTWLHLDIPLSSYTNANHSLNLHHINQMGLIDNNAGETPGADYYIDNLFFYVPTNTPVTVAMTSPTEGATVGNFFTVKASATVYPGAVTNVNFYDGATLLGNATAAPYNYYIGNGVAAGAHTLTAVAQTSTGSSATSAAVHITVTNNPPLVVREPFNYPLGAFPNNTPATGTGLAGNWSVVNDTVVAGLTYPNLPTGNNALKQNQASTRSSVNFAYPVSPSGTKYVSYLFQTLNNSGGDTVGAYLIGNNATSLYVGFNGGYSGSQTMFGLGSVTTAGGAVPASMWSGATVPASNAAVHLIVLRIDFNTAGANDLVSLWIDPPAGTNAPGVAANVSNGTHDIGTLSGIGLNVMGGYTPTIDEIRVGDTYGSVVGAVVSTPTVPTTIAISTSAGKQVSWTAYSTNSYQPQKSTDNSTWVDWGSLIAGAAVTSLYDPAPVDYYRVLEVTPGGPGPDELLNGSFEIPEFNNSGAANWSSSANTAYESVWVTNQYGALLPVSGTALMFMQGTTDASTPTPPNAFLLSDRFPVTAGLAYNVKFSAANPVQVGGANPQYRVQFFDAGNAFISEQWRSFASAGSTWTQFSVTNTAPANAATMNIFFMQAIGAGASWNWVTLIDDVSVHAIATPGPINELSPVVRPGASFAATVRTNGETATATTGTVKFLTNGVQFSVNALTDGIASSANTLIAPPYTVTAIYSGDGTYFGCTNTLVVNESYFGTASGSVSLSGGIATVLMSGLEGNKYAMQRATDVSFTQGLRTFPTVTAPAGGEVSVLDDFSDVGSVPAAAFYRLQYIP